MAVSAFQGSGSWILERRTLLSPASAARRSRAWRICAQESLTKCPPKYIPNQHPLACVYDCFHNECVRSLFQKWAQTKCQMPGRQRDLIGCRPSWKGWLSRTRGTGFKTMPSFGLWLRFESFDNYSCKFSLSGGHI